MTNVVSHFAVMFDVLAYAGTAVADIMVVVVIDTGAAFFVQVSTTIVSICM